MNFHAAVLVKTFLMMYQLLMLDWYWQSQGNIFSWGMETQTDRQTDTVLESSHGNMSAHKKIQLKAQN